jgi:hypothetical protein
MATRYKLREVERLEGDLNEVIPKLVNQGGQAFAAIVLKVSQATISTWLKTNGYKKVERWEKSA